MSLKLPIYMDHHATTPVAPEVFEAMRPYFLEHFGNAASRNHAFGWAAEGAVEAARAEVARLIGCKPIEIVFTSGATESDNLAVKGVAEAYRDKGRHLITSQVEHHAVLDVCKRLEKDGCQVTYLPVDRHGMVDPAAVARAITSKTVLVSIMLANNEVGTIQPLAEIGRICKERGVFLPLRRRPGCREDPGRGGCVGGGPALPDRPQALWAERGRGPLCPDGAAACTPGPSD